MKKKVFALFIVTLMVFGVLSGCGNRDGDGASGGGRNAAAGGTFRLGGTGPLTGGAAIFGNAVRNGAQIAVDEINARNGAVKFDFRFEDDQHNAELAVNAFNSLRDWGIQVSTLTVTSGPATNVNVIANEARIFSMTPSASSTLVTEGLDNIFQMCFTDPMQGTAAANYIANRWPNARVAVIYKDDCVYSTGVFEKFNATANERGINNVSTTTFATGREHDFNAQLQSARNGNAEIVFLPIYYTPASLILTQANAMGFSPIFFGIDGMDGILGMEGFDTSLAEGVILLTPFDADNPDSKVQNFVTKYQAAHGEIPNQFAAGAYDVVWALYEMLNSVGANSGMTASQINDLLVPLVTGSFTFNGVTGNNMTWDTTGQVNKGAYAVIIQDGRYVSFN